MARAECQHCSAPLDRSRTACKYCGSRVELDLHGSLAGRLYSPESDRHCPHCNIKLETIDLKVDQRLLIEKCSQCHGLFFDLGELDLLLERSVSGVHHIDKAALQTLAEANFSAQPREFRYVKCPVCSTTMNRHAFGYKSGVVVDYCSKHGFWLDAGELRQLQEWKKAGGELQQQAAGRHYPHIKKEGSPAASTRPSSVESARTPRTHGRKIPADGLTDTLLDIVSSIFH